MTINKTFYTDIIIPSIENSLPSKKYTNDSFASISYILYGSTEQVKNFIVAFKISSKNGNKD